MFWMSTELCKAVILYMIWAAFFRPVTCTQNDTTVRTQAKMLGEHCYCTSVLRQRGRIVLFTVATHTTQSSCYICQLMGDRTRGERSGMHMIASSVRLWAAPQKRLLWPHIWIWVLIHKPNLFKVCNYRLQKFRNHETDLGPNYEVATYTSALNLREGIPPDMRAW